MAKRTGAGPGTRTKREGSAPRKTPKPRTPRRKPAKAESDDVPPWLAWMLWPVPQRGRRFFKTKLAVLILVCFALGRTAYVHVRYSIAVARLEARGYVVDPDYDVAYSQRWRHPDDPERGVTFFRYPRPEGSPFERVNSLLMRESIARRDWQGRALELGRSVFLAGTAPLLAPIDSRDGFDPYSAVNEERAKRDLLEELLKKKISDAGEGG